MTSTASATWTPETPAIKIGLSNGPCFLLLLAEAAAARGFDHEDVAGREVGRVAAAHGGQGAVGALHPVAAEGAGGAAAQAEGGDPAMAAERADRHRLEEPDPADSAVAAVPAAVAAAAGADRVGLGPDRGAPFELLGVGEPGVGHLRLHHVGAVDPLAGARAAGHRLVVLVPVVAEGDIVHRPRPLRHHVERSVEGAGDRLAGLDVAGGDGGRVLGAEHRPGRDYHGQRLQAARVERYVLIDEGAEHVQHGRHRHPRRGVEVVGQLRAGAGEVDDGRPGARVNGYFHPDHRPIVHLVGVLAVGQPGDDVSHRLGRVLLDVTHVGPDHIQAVLRDHPAQLFDALLIGGHLGSEVREVGVRVPGGVFGAEKQLPGLLLAQPAVLDQEPVVEQHALLLDAGARGRHRAGGHAAYLGVVTAGGDVEPRDGGGVGGRGGGRGGVMALGATGPPYRCLWATGPDWRRYAGGRED